MKAGYTIDNIKINNLLFMDVLKLYGKDEKAIDKLMNTVFGFSSDIRMEFVIQKCSVLALKRGKLHKSEGIELIIKEITFARDINICDL